MKLNEIFLGMRESAHRMNYQSLLTSFNQGRQSTGHSRKPKFNLQKKRLSELENYQILHYEPDDDRSH